MEQLVARRAHNPKVAGSSPAPATTKALQLILEGFFYIPLADSKLFKEWCR